MSKKILLLIFITYKSCFEKNDDFGIERLLFEIYE
jgi:hypothetical protein